MGWLSDNFGAKNLDEDGQPANQFYRAHAIEARQVDELIGLVKGILADGAICQGEVEFLLKWMQTNQAARNDWPAKALYPRIASALADGRMDAGEETEIMSLLMATVGGNTAPAEGEASDSTTLPLCDPAPSVDFHGRVFCFTGKFHGGTRDWCEQQVLERGGLSAPGITRKLNFLVIGELGSRDWLHSTYGLKIKKAVEYRESGVPLHIISEECWYGRVAL